MESGSIFTPARSSFSNLHALRMKKRQAEVLRRHLNWIPVKLRIWAIRQNPIFRTSTSCALIDRILPILPSTFFPRILVITICYSYRHSTLFATKRPIAHKKFYSQTFFHRVDKSGSTSVFLSAVQFQCITHLIHFDYTDRQQQADLQEVRTNSQKLAIFRALII